MVTSQAKPTNINWIVLLSCITIITIARLIPHYPNFTPVAAFGLFSAYLFRNKLMAIVLPLSGMLVSDTVIELIRPGMGFHATMFFVYLSFAIICMLGLQIKSPTQILKIAGLSISGSAIFFLITNFSVWMMQAGLYPHTAAGLLSCYIAGIPFAFNFIGDLFFNAVFFGSFYLIARSNLTLQKVYIRK